MNALANPEVRRAAEAVSANTLGKMLGPDETASAADGTEIPDVPKDSPSVHRVHEEAKFRFAQILREIQSDLHPYIHFELQERMKGIDIPDAEAVIRMDELETLLYAESLPKPDIRLIIAGIRHRARKAQQASEELAKRRQKADKEAGVKRPTKTA